MSSVFIITILQSLVHIIRLINYDHFNPLPLRLLRRRMLRKKELKSLALLKKGGQDDDMEEEERELEQAFLAAEEEIEKKIKDIEETSNSVREKLISGLKKRFFYETKAAKLKGAPNVRALVAIYTQGWAQLPEQ